MSHADAHARRRGLVRVYVLTPILAVALYKGLHFPLIIAIVVGYVAALAIVAVGRRPPTTPPSRE